jgi:hypothetical protein
MRFISTHARVRAVTVAAFVTVAVTGIAAPTAGARLHTLQPAVEIQALCQWITPGLEACRSGRNEHTKGGPGTGMVSHAEWPPFNGVLWRVASLEPATHWFTGGAHSDKLMGHHGNDIMAGKAASDVLWGDYDANNNNKTQVDYLSGGKGNDFLYASHGLNLLRGGPGKDLLQAYYGHGVLDCGSGTHDTAKIRRHSNRYKVYNCENIKYPCPNGNDGHGKCLKQTASTAATRR